MITVLQRVCWNSRSWKLPSGETFDSGNPGKIGFGNEEWNFCKEDSFEGNVFGWLYWSATKFSGEHFRILFWTIPPSRKDRLLVGAYHDASLATKAELLRLRSDFSRRGVGRRRREEAIDAVLRSGKNIAENSIRPASAIGLKFKCPERGVEIFHPYRILPKRLQGKKVKVSTRFKNPALLDSSTTELLLGSPGKFAKQQHYLLSPLLEEVYPRATPASLKIITPKHKELSNLFVRWVASTGRQVIGREKNRVDVEFRDGRMLCRAELKVCYGMATTAAIREAMGQLLEYNYYGWRAPADRWFIVLDSEPSNEDVKYVRTLSSEKRLPLVLSWKSGDGFKQISQRAENSL
jgi:hypothetical protein